MAERKALSTIPYVAAAVGLASIWLVPQVFVGDFQPLGISNSWGWIILAGVVFVLLAAAKRAMAAKRLPWPDALIAIAVYVAAEGSWRVSTGLLSSGPNWDFYKPLWAWIGAATPLFTIAILGVAAALVLSWRRDRRVQA